MDNTLKERLEKMAGNHAEEIVEAVFNAAKDGDDDATDILMEAAADAGMCDILQLRVIMTSKGMSVTTGGSRPVRRFFEDKLPGASEAIMEYSEKAMELGEELVEKIKPMMIEHGMALAEADKEK